MDAYSAGYGSMPFASKYFLSRNQSTTGLAMDQE